MKFVPLLHNGLFMFVFVIATLMTIQEKCIYQKTGLVYHRYFFIFFTIMSLDSFLMVIVSLFFGTVKKSFIYTFLIFQILLIFLAFAYFMRALIRSRVNKQDKLSFIYKFNNRSQAEVLLGLFKKQNVFAIQRLFEDSAYDGVYKLQHGMGEIFVRKKDLSAAKAIIKEFESAYKKHTLNKELKALKEELFEKGRNFNRAYCIAIGILFSVIGFYVLICSQYKVLSAVFFFASLLFFLVFYIMRKE